MPKKTVKQEVKEEVTVSVDFKAQGNVFFAGKKYSEVNFI